MVKQCCRFAKRLLWLITVGPFYALWLLFRTIFITPAIWFFRLIKQSLVLGMRILVAPFVFAAYLIKLPFLVLAAAFNFGTTVTVEAFTLPYKLLTLIPWHGLVTALGMVARASTRIATAIMHGIIRSTKSSFQMAARLGTTTGTACISLLLFGKGILLAIAYFGKTTIIILGHAMTTSLIWVASIAKATGIAFGHFLGSIAHHIATVFSLIAWAFKQFAKGTLYLAKTATDLTTTTIRTIIHGVGTGLYHSYRWLTSSIVFIGTSIQQLGGALLWLFTAIATGLLRAGHALYWIINTSTHHFIITVRHTWHGVGNSISWLAHGIGNTSRLFLHGIVNSLQWTWHGLGSIISWITHSIGNASRLFLHGLVRSLQCTVRGLGNIFHALLAGSRHMALWARHGISNILQLFYWVLNRITAATAQTIRGIGSAGRFIGLSAYSFIQKTADIISISVQKIWHLVRLGLGSLAQACKTMIITIGAGISYSITTFGYLAGKFTIGLQLIFKSSWYYALWCIRSFVQLLHSGMDLIAALFKYRIQPSAAYTAQMVHHGSIIAIKTGARGSLFVGKTLINSIIWLGSLPIRGTQYAFTRIIKPTANKLHRAKDVGAIQIAHAITLAPTIGTLIWQSIATTIVKSYRTLHRTFKQMRSTLVLTGQIIGSYMLLFYDQLWLASCAIARMTWNGLVVTVAILRRNLKPTIRLLGRGIGAVTRALFRTIRNWFVHAWPMIRTGLLLARDALYASLYALWQTAYALVMIPVNIVKAAFRAFYKLLCGIWFVVVTVPLRIITWAWHAITMIPKALWWFISGLIQTLFRRPPADIPNDLALADGTIGIARRQRRSHRQHRIARTMQKTWRFIRKKIIPFIMLSMTSAATSFHCYAITLGRHIATFAHTTSLLLYQILRLLAVCFLRIVSFVFLMPIRTIVWLIKTAGVSLNLFGKGVLAFTNGFVSIPDLIFKLLKKQSLQGACIGIALIASAIFLQYEYRTTTIVEELQLPLPISSEIRNFSSNVETGMIINQFPACKLYSNQCTIDATVWFKFPAGTESVETLTPFSFKNGTIKTISKPTITQTGTSILARYQVLLELETNLNFHQFPFGGHRLHLIMENRSVSPQEIAFSTSPDSMSVAHSAMVPPWHTTATHANAGYLTEGTNREFSEYPVVIYAIDLASSSLLTVATIFLPLFFLFFIGLAAFTTDIHDSYKMRLSVASTVALVLFRIIFDAQFPSYVTLTKAELVYLLLTALSLFTLIFTIYNHGRIRLLNKLTSSEQEQITYRLTYVNSVLFIAVLVAFVGGLAYIALAF